MNKIFMDLEANQQNKDDYLLQIGAIKFDEEGNFIENFNEYCQSKVELNPRIATLLNKTQQFFDKQEIDEEQLYNRFKDFSKDCQIISFGYYDKKVLQAVHKRYALEKIKIKNFQKVVEKQLGVSNHNISLYCLLKACGIQCIENQHDALSDAQYLKQVYDEFYLNKNNDEWISKILIECIRPKFKKINSLNNVFESFIPDINKTYSYIFFDYKKEKIRSDEIRDYFNHFLKITIYSHNNEIMYQVESEFDETENDDFNIIIKEIFEKQIYPNLDKSVLIVNSASHNKICALMNDYCLENNQKYIQYYWLDKRFFKTFRSFNEIEYSEELVIKVINSFYDYNHKNFDTKINYSNFWKKIY